MSRLFGTDGVRGVANTELTPWLAFQLGYHGAAVLAGQNAGRPRILVGHDARISSDMLQSALVAGITASGADAYIAGMIPTPGIAYLTATQEFDAGVMISASHNSFEFNGIKFFNHQGFKLADAVEDEIEAAIRASGSGHTPSGSGASLGRAHDYSVGETVYLDHLKTAGGLDLSGFKIVIDCANGASSRLGVRLFEDLGASVTALSAEPSGVNINDGCGSTHLGNLCEATRRAGADIGLAFDGDADRMLAVDQNGQPVDGDQIMAIIAACLKAQGRLPQDTLVVTVMSNLGLRIAAKRLGLKLACTKVGDRYVLEEMQEKGYGFGGEQSGHLILLEKATTGDGLLSALLLLDALCRRGESLAEAAAIMHIYPQILVPALVPNDRKAAAMADAEVQALIEAIGAKMGDDGRVLVRPSGTEPQIRVMLEGDDQAVIESYAHQIADLIVRKYGQA